MLFFVIAVLVLYQVYIIVRRKWATPDYTAKTVWITGGSSGIGEHLAYEFNRLGAHLIISARKENQLERVKNNCSFPERVQIVRMDMVNYDEVKTITKQVLDKLSAEGRRCDVVIENAGVSMRSKFVDYAFENHQQLFNVNVNGPYNHIQAILPHMIANKAGQVVGITSVSGKLSPAYRTSYSGSKSAFIGILDSLRSELYPFNIKVTNIMPGYVKTNISINAMAAGVGEKFGSTDKNIEKGMDPNQFAKDAVRAIFRGENEVHISKQWNVTLGMLMRNICPDLVFFMLLRNAKNQQQALKKQ